MQGQIEAWKTGTQFNASSLLIPLEVSICKCTNHCSPLRSCLRFGEKDSDPWNFNTFLRKQTYERHAEAIALRDISSMMDKMKGHLEVNAMPMAIKSPN
jgi:hypothetical protein